MKDPLDSQVSYQDIMQAPVLFDSAFDDDKTQGLVTLSDCIECKVVFNWNSFPTLQMTYPRDGVGALLLDYDKVIMTDVSWKWTHQKFRIQQIQREGDDYLINATHIIGDLLNQPITEDISLPDASATDVANQIINTLAGDDHDFSFESDVTKLSNVSITAGPAGNIFIDPDQEGDQPTASIIGLFGGELEFDNRTIYHHKHAGRTTGIKVSYGKNLITINDDTDLNGTYTAICPTATYAPAQPKATMQNVNWGNWNTDYTSIGSVTYSAGGSVEIYDSPIEGHHVIERLNNGDHITLGKPVADGTLIPNPQVPNSTLEIDTVNGDTWYPIQGGGWIDARWVNFSKSGDYLINPVTGHVTVGSDGTDPNSWSLRNHQYGWLICNYKGFKGGIHVYRDPEIGDQHHPNGDQYLKFGQKVSFDMVETNAKGDTWYRIGSHQWVYGPHVTVSFSGANVQYPTQGSGYVKPGAQRYHWDSKKKQLVKDKDKTVTQSNKRKTRPTHKTVRGKDGKKRKKNTTSGYKSKPKKVRKTVPKGIHSISKTITQGGKTYVKTSGGWTLADNVSYNRIGTHKPKSWDSYVKEEIQNTGKLEMYQDPNRTKDLNWSIPIGVSLDVINDGQAFDGVEMYEVTYKGKTGWIRADLTNTKGDIDVEPYSPQDQENSDGDGDGSSANIPTNVKDVVVKVGTIYSDATVSPENARIALVDLTSYFHHDDTDMSGLQADGTFAATDKDKEQLIDLAKKYMIDHDFGHPKTSLTVGYQQLTGFAGDATQLNLYDYVDVEYPQLGVHAPAEVTSTTWDCIAHRYEQVTIGELPKSWQHLLLQATDKQTSGSIATSERRTQGWLNRFENMMKSEGSDRIAKENKMMDELGNIRHDVTYIDPKTGKKETLKSVFLQSRKDFEEQFSALESDAADIKGWIDAPGSGVIRAIPNWQTPQQLTANASNGAKMVFGGNGLEFFDPQSNKLLTGFDSRGKLYADSIEGVTVKAMEIDALTMKGSLQCKDSNSNMQIYIGTQNPGSVLNPWKGGKVMWAVSDTYQSMVSSGQIATTSNNYTTRIHPSAITVGDDDNQVLTQKNFAAHAYYRIKSWVKLWIADYLTINGHKRMIWKGIDKGRNMGKLRNLPNQGRHDYSYVPGANDQYGYDESNGLDGEGIDFDLNITLSPEAAARISELTEGFQQQQAQMQAMDNLLNNITSGGHGGGNSGSINIGGGSPIVLGYSSSDKSRMLTYTQASHLGLLTGVAPGTTQESIVDGRTYIYGTYTPTGNMHWFRRG